jgi:glycosyltransferase involved in cell wall biosynthesis
VNKQFHQEYLKHAPKARHLEMKQKILLNYFGIKSDKIGNYTLFVYVHRITRIKGLYLLLESIEILLKDKFNYCLFFIRGKMDNSPYSHKCLDKLNQLSDQFPENINFNISHFVKNK